MGAIIPDLNFEYQRLYTNPLHILKFLNQNRIWKQELPWDTINIMPKLPNIEFVNIQGL